MITEDYIADLVKKAITSDNLFLVEVLVDKNNGIKVILDSDKTVAISDCISISKSVEKNLDRDEQDFSLEVTSAGVGQPLKLIRQYSKHIGKQLEVTIDSGLVLSGELKAVTNDCIKLEENATKKKREEHEGNALFHKFNMNNIKMAKAIITI